MGNELQLYRLVSNLMANAIQYRPPGGSVVISLSTHDRTATIAIKDTGLGIPPKEQSRVFGKLLSGEQRSHPAKQAVRDWGSPLPRPLCNGTRGNFP